MLGDFSRAKYVLPDKRNRACRREEFSSFPAASSKHRYCDCKRGTRTDTGRRCGITPPPPASPPPLCALFSPTVDAGRLFMDAGFGVAKPKPAKKKKAAKRSPSGAAGGVAKGQRKAESFVYTGSLRPGVRSPRRAVRTNCQDLNFFFCLVLSPVRATTYTPCLYIS